MNRYFIDNSEYKKTIDELQKKLQETDEKLSQAYSVIDELEFELSDVLMQLKTFCFNLIFLNFLERLFGIGKSANANEVTQFTI